jgi:hypothetical protein
VNFTTLDATMANGGKLTVKLVASDGTTTTFVATYPQSAAVADVRDAVYLSIPKPVDGKNGWAVQSLDGPDGPRISITGFYDNTGKLIPIKTPSFTTDKGRGPKIINTSGVTTGQLTTGTPWDIVLAPSPDDGSQTVPVDSTLALTLNGTAVNVSLHQGESLTQATNDIFVALTTAGVDASLNGNDVAFLHDSTGQEITSVAELLTPVSSGQTYLNSWFEVDLSIAQRIIQ